MMISRQYHHLNGLTTIPSLAKGLHTLPPQYRRQYNAANRRMRVTLSAGFKNIPVVFPPNPTVVPGATAQPRGLQFPLPAPIAAGFFQNRSPWNLHCQPYAYEH